MTDKVCTHSMHLPDSWKLSTYLSVGGYDALKKIIAEKMPAEEIINQV